jgi:hypothetical protein
MISGLFIVENVGGYILIIKKSYLVKVDFIEKK